MWLNKKTTENLLLFFGAILVGVGIYAANADADSAYNLWLMSLPESLRYIVVYTVIGGGIFAAPAWIIVTIILRVRQYIKGKKDGTGEYYTPDDTNLSDTHDPDSNSELSLYQTSPFDERTDIKQSLLLIVGMAVVATPMTFGFSLAALESGGGAAWLALIFPLFVWSPLVYAILVKKEIRVGRDTATVYRTRLGCGRTFRFGDIVSIERQHPSEGDATNATGTIYKFGDYFIIKRSWNDKGIKIYPSYKGYDELKKGLEYRVPHLCYWLSGAQVPSESSTSRGYDRQAAYTRQAEPWQQHEGSKMPLSSRLVGVFLLLAVGTIITVMISLAINYNNSPPESSPEDHPYARRRTQRVSPAEQDVVQENIADMEAAGEDIAEMEASEEDIAEPTVELPLVPWDMSVQIPDSSGSAEISAAVIGMLTENVCKLMRFSNKFEIIFEFSVWMEATSRGTFYTVMEPNDVYRVTVQSDGETAQITVEASDGSVVVFEGNDSEFVRVDPGTGERVDASAEPVWNPCGDYYTDDSGLMRMFAPAYRFRTGFRPLSEDKAQWQEIMCDSETYIYRTSNSGTGIERSEDAEIMSGGDNITHYFSEDTGDWVGMRLTYSENIREPGSDFYIARQHADFKILEVRYS